MAFEFVVNQEMALTDWLLMIVLKLFGRVTDPNHMKLIYNSEYSFQPKVGVKYYLYQRKDMSSFLSLISPSEWDKKLIGKFRLKSDGRWVLED